jgi:hypothetical protein
VSTSEKFARFVENGCAEHRPVTVNDHQQFREAIATPKPCDAIDEAAADPIHDHAPRRASHGKVNRVLGILDQLERESNRRFNT